MCAQRASGVARAAKDARRPGRAADASAEGRDGTDGKGGAGTRQSVIEAAIKCILEQGFYRASSNAIAERAGVTWGVIQYHFGTREALMLAVLREGSRRLAETLSAADITGQSLTERIEQFFDVLAEYYGSPDYLAFTQVLVNLGHDPRTSEQARQTLTAIGESANPELRRLAAEVIGETGTRGRHDLVNLLFHTLRGLSISHNLLGTIPPYTPGPRREYLADRRMLARALSMLIEQELGTGGS